MRKMATLFVALFVMMTWMVPVLADDKPDMSGVIALLSEDGFAHACPVRDPMPGSQGDVLTIYVAGHVVRDLNVDDEKEGARYSWEDRLGNQGTTNPGPRSEYRDIGEITLSGDTDGIHYYPRAKELPQEGDKVYWVQFEKKSVQDEDVDAKVAYYRAGYIFYDKSPRSGASGSCLFNEAGEVVAIVAWGLTYTPSDREGSATIIVMR